jgi:twinkle protein
VDNIQSIKQDEDYSPKEFTLEYLPWRGLTKETMQFFGMKTRVTPEGRPHSVMYPYPAGGVKNREFSNHKFWSTGPMSAPGLFGQDKFPAGSAKAITITEGEPDAASAFQMLGSQYPAVSIRSSATARKDCQQAFEYLNSFERIYLCLDNDEAGRKATQEIASLFDFNKVYHVKLEGHKDANAFLEARQSEQFKRIWWNARRYLPEGIVSSHSEFRSILEADVSKPSVPYPFDGLNAKLLGIRTGEFVLVTAPEGIGKTEFIRRIEHHLLRNTDASIACIHLEETKARQLKGLAGLHLRTAAHLPDGAVSLDEIDGALKELTHGRDDRLHIYSHFGSDDPDVLINSIRFLGAVCGCKYIFLDHITMVVSGLADEDERRTLDYLSTKLATLCHDLDITIFCISHVNDDGKTRGSRNISKVANLRIDLARDLVAELEADRNKTFVTVSKNRYAGKTGPAGVLKFDPEEFMLKDDDGIVMPPVE